MEINELKIENLKLKNDLISDEINSLQKKLDKSIEVTIVLLVAAKKSLEICKEKKLHYPKLQAKDKIMKCSQLLAPLIDFIMERKELRDEDRKAVARHFNLEGAQ